MRSLFGLRSVAQALDIDSRDVLLRMGGAAGSTLVANMAPRTDDWYSLVKNQSEHSAELVIYDEIGWFGTTAKDVAQQLSALDVSHIDVRINSMGGDVFDGIAIYNALRTHDAEIRTQVDSAALSIASVIAQAGDHRVMVSGSQMMIHEAWGLSVGNATDMRKFGDLLDKQTDTIAGIYAERVGGSGKVKHFRSLMVGETWLSADEAVAEGLADEVFIPKSKTKDSTPGLETDEAEAQARRKAAFMASTRIST